MGIMTSCDRNVVGLDAIGNVKTVQISTFLEIRIYSPYGGGIKTTLKRNLKVKENAYQD